MPKTNERSTTPPAFDPIQYARASDARIKTQVPRSERRLATRALPTIDDETWARGIVRNAVHRRSPFGGAVSLPLDHRAGFLLSLMDGTLDLESAVRKYRRCPGKTRAARGPRALFEAGVIAFR